MTQRVRAVGKCLSCGEAFKSLVLRSFSSLGWKCWSRVLLRSSPAPGHLSAAPPGGGRWQTRLCPLPEDGRVASLVEVVCSMWRHAAPLRSLMLTFASCFLQNRRVHVDLRTLSLTPVPAQCVLGPPHLTSFRAPRAGLEVTRYCIRLSGAGNGRRWDGFQGRIPPYARAGHLLGRSSVSKYTSP